MGLGVRVRRGEDAVDREGGRGVVRGEPLVMLEVVRLGRGRG